MKSIYQKHLAIASSIENKSEQLAYLTSVLRSLLQLTVITSFELIKAQAPHDEINLVEFTERFCKPSDGLPLQIFDHLTPFARAYINKNYLTGWFEKTRSIKTPISKQLIEWVQFRNKRTGHGVLDFKTTEIWSKKTEDIIKDCLIVFDSIIPSIDKEGIIKISKEFNNLKIKTPVTEKEHAFVILEISHKKGIWKLKGQLLSINNAEEFTVVLPEENIFSGEGLKSTGKYELTGFISNNNEHSFFHNIPVRQTDIFEGRQTEIKQLVEWIDDEDSRYCLVFGDGGYGKTTLVLEFFNLIMESEFNFKRPFPEVVSYYTAKKTRWNESGLIHFTSINPAMDECLRELVRCFNPMLSKEWYKTEGRNIISKTEGVLKENGYTRNDVMLIIDNTETLATSSAEVKELGSFFKQVGKLIGRLIITSRRREFIEATPIYVEGLTEEESVRLIQRLAKEYNAKSINQAGESKLRKISNQLTNKPLLLEALVKYISRSSLGIDAAISNVFKKSNDELLEFLYEDAWLRMNELQQKVFLTLVHITSPLDQISISRTCQEIGIQHSEFQSALEETNFAILTDHGKSYSLDLIDLARKFFEQQFLKLTSKEDKNTLKKLASEIDNHVKKRKQVEDEYKTDRVAEAFRYEYARSAKVYADKGDIEDAIEMYKLAIEDDPVNSALHDRFSWLLLNRTQDFEFAKIISEKAVELDNSNCDAIVGLALVYYRLGDITNGDKKIGDAKKLGRSSSFCLLRKGIARFHKAKNINSFNESIKILEEAQDMLNIAGKLNKNYSGYGIKNQHDINRYQELTRALLITLRSKRTRALHLSGESN